MMYRIEDENKNPAILSSYVLNYFIKYFPDDIKTDNISDWYHTFWELYKHRIHLFIALCRPIKNWDDEINVIKSHKHFDDSQMEWWFIVQMDTPYWQISYHLPNEYWDKCDYIKTVDKANEWDGHTSDDVLERLLKL